MFQMLTEIVFQNCKIYISGRCVALRVKIENRNNMKNGEKCFANV